MGNGAMVTSGLCALLCYGGWAALWGVYALGNPDLYTVSDALDAEPLHCLVKTGA